MNTYRILIDRLENTAHQENPISIQADTYNIFEDWLRFSIGNEVVANFHKKFVVYCIRENQQEATK